MLNPRVGEMREMSSWRIDLHIVVLPALSRPLLTCAKGGMSKSGGEWRER